MSLTLSLRFPTGRYAATAWEDREQAEWPPHPARLALAFIDVLHKLGNPEHLRSDLMWLCQQGPPSIVIPADGQIDVQRMDGFFVPQNPSQAESHKHPRKPRSFPTVFLDPEPAAVYFQWSTATPDDARLAGLRELASHLPRFGHSSSLVTAAITKDDPPFGASWRRLDPLKDTTHQADCHLRVPYAGLIQSAESAFDAKARAKEMANLIRKAAESARPDKALKPAASPRGRHDPRHHWQGYIEELPSAMPVTSWDRRVLLLSRIDGPRPELISTWQILEVFHKTILDRWSRAPDQAPIPSWISGHLPGDANTAPNRANHLAMFPLADVSHRHAQGRLMGIGLAFPRPETAELDPVTLRLDWRKAMASLFPDGSALELTAPAGGPRLILQPAVPGETRRALRIPSWIGPSATWSSVTPVVLDRHPKPHFRKNPVAWAASARQIVIEACQRIGLPAPLHIDVSPYSPIQGVPPSNAFAPPPARPGRPARVHFHVSVQFGQKVGGPLLLGAGRFRGYGLLAPTQQGEFAP